MLLAAVARVRLEAQTTETYTFATNRVVPDGNAAGVSDVRNLSSAIGAIRSVTVRLKITGEFNGDLYGYVRHAGGFAVLLNRSGKNISDTHGYADSGFDVTFQTGAANGDIHLYQSGAAPVNGFPLGGVWEPDGRTVDPANVTDGASRATSLTNFNGLSAAGQWTFYLVDPEGGGTNMFTEWGLDITGATVPTLAWSNPADIIYGTALGAAQLNAAATSSSTNVPGIFTYTPSVGTILNAGPGQTLSVHFTPSNTTDFLPIITTVAIKVLKAPLTITANDTSKVYGAALPTFTAGYSGFLNGDTAASLDAPVTLGTTATASSPVGAYAITASGATDTNYAVTFVNGTLTVYAVNPPPLLSLIPDAIITPDDRFRFIANASDPDGEHLAFSLDPGAPAGARINLTNGIFRWHPTRAYASTTNLITVRVTDNGVPPVSAAQSFTVTVLDYLELTIGSTNLQSGQSVGVPIYLASDRGVTNLEFSIPWVASYLANARLAVTAPAIALASLQDQTTNLLITMQTSPGQVLQGTQQIAQLSFVAIPNPHSAFIPLPIGGANAAKPDGSFYSYYLTHSGTVAAVDNEPLLMASLSTNQNRTLIVFGKLGAVYQVQSSTDPISAGWQPLVNYTQTNGVMTIGVGSADPLIFYRLFQP